MSTAERDLALLDLIVLIEQEEVERCGSHPAYLIDRMHAIDERDAVAGLEESVFYLDVLSPAERREANATLIEAFGEDEEGWPKHLGWRAKSGDWFWQREVLDWWLDYLRTISLKARQLGITWDACGFTGWTALYKPGSTCLHYRQKEEDAFENVRCTWELIDSLPAHLLNGAVLEKPSRVDQPIATKELRFRFPDGRASTVVAKTSASESGHGGRAAVTVLDEFSRIENAAGIMKATNSAAGRRGRIIIISTANGRANLETGDGNRYHWMWVNADAQGYAKKFLPWSLHPERDAEWYANDPEVRGLMTHERAEQYPANEIEAFSLTNAVYYDAEDMAWYAQERTKAPEYRMDFVEPDAHERFARGGFAFPKQHDRGLIRVYAEPQKDRRYAIGADVASGHGRDYSCAYVIDLHDQSLVAQLHGKIPEDLYAAQLHYLGRWYGRVGAGHNPADPQATGFAKLAIETQGGFGTAVISALRDRTAGRPAYENLYRSVLDNRSDKPIAKPWGFGMNQATRTKVLSGIGMALRERTLPWLDYDALQELGNFVRHDHGTTPRAIDGTNDDRVMALGIALEMFRQYGHHASKPRHKPRRRGLVGIGRERRAA